MPAAATKQALGHHLVGLSGAYALFSTKRLLGNVETSLDRHGQNNDQDRTHRLRLGLLGRHLQRRRPAGEGRRAGLPGVRLPGRNHPVDHGRRAPEEPRGRLRHRLRRSAGAAAGRDRRQARPRRQQCRRGQPAGLRQGPGSRLREGRGAAEDRRAGGRQPAAPGRRAGQGRDRGNVQRRPAAADVRVDERLPGRARHSRSAGAGRGHRHHRPRGGQRGGQRRPGTRVRLGLERLRQTGPGRAGRAHHRMRRAVHRRQLHRLGKRAGLRAHRLPHRRSAGQRRLRGHQAAGHGRPGHPAERRRADALRDRRPARLSAARRGLRLHRRAAAPGRPRPRRPQRRPRPAAHRPVQGQRHLSRRLPLHRQLPDRRHRRSEEGRAREPGDHRQDRGDVRRTRLGPLPRNQHRTARQRSHLRPPRPPPGQPRDRGQARRAPRPQGGAGAVLPRDRPGRHRHGPGPDRHRRRAAHGLPGDPPVLLPGGQGALPTGGAHRRGQPCRRPATAGALRPGEPGRSRASPYRHRPGHGQRAAGEAGGGALRRQGRPQQHRRDGAQARIPAVDRRGAERRRGGRVDAARAGSAAGPRQPLVPAGQPQPELPAGARPGRRRRGQPAHRPAGQGLRPATAGIPGGGAAAHRR